MRWPNLLFLILIFPFGLCAQNAGLDFFANIVPNASFEELARPPIGWFYKGEHFTKVMKYWSSATVASPDVFGPRVRVPMHWAEKGFGGQKAQDGHSMIGITVFGCGEGKPHCREYAQIQLKEPLVIGQQYSVEFWVSHLPQSLWVNNIGIHFAMDRLQVITDKALNLEPVVNEEELLKMPPGAWKKITGRFKAKDEAAYLVLGNFFPDSLTQTLTPPSNTQFPFGYYYVDNIVVRKEKPILPVPIKEDDLSLAKLEEGATIRLNNIFFETDESELLPRSYTELKKLLTIMDDNPEMIIEIQGHTDNRGDDVYNLDLSSRRAKAVVDYLIENGIEEPRLRHQGYGRSQPAATNATKEGRQSNRRVEFLIIQKKKLTPTRTPN